MAKQERTMMATRKRTKVAARNSKVKNTALFTVMIRRDIADDADAYAVKRPTNKQLIKFLVEELQNGWDMAGIAGHFSINKIERVA